MTRPMEPPDPFFDDRIADWLETDPQRAPDPVLDTILAALPSIPQRRLGRRSWRFPAMTTPLKIAAAAVAILFVGFVAVDSLSRNGGLGTSPSSSPSVAPSPSPSAARSPSVPPTPSPPNSPAAVEMTTFTSDRYGYTIEYPARFDATAATDDWAVGELVAPTSTVLDRFFAVNPAGGATRAFMGFASVALPEGMDGEAWMRSHMDAVAGAGGGCSGFSTGTWVEVDLFGVVGRRLDIECNGLPVTDFIFVVEDRAWIATGDRGLVEPAIATMQLP